MSKQFNQNPLIIFVGADTILSAGNSANVSDVMLNENVEQQFRLRRVDEKRWDSVVVANTGWEAGDAVLSPDFENALDQVSTDRPRNILVIVIGENDLMNGKSLESTWINIKYLVGKAKKRGCEVYISTILDNKSAVVPADYGEKRTMLESLMTHPLIDGVADWSAFFPDGSDPSVFDQITGLPLASAHMGLAHELVRLIDNRT